MYNAYCAKGGVLVVPSDTQDLAVTAGIPLEAQELYIGSAGSLKITTEDGSVLTYATLQAGTVLRMRTARVWATGTTAADIIAHY